MLKKSTYKIYSLLVLICLSCEKELPNFLTYKDYSFASLDVNGGSWKPILISNGDAITIAVPELITSNAYKQELAEVKMLSSNVSQDEKELINYWSQNPTIRWNEIALELIAKYNLIPGPNSDGTYTLPNSNNPAGPPAFPFAHPPYAVRALAYLSVAQFDGLIVAWNYKFKYNRAAPFIQDQSIPTTYIANNLPSYPSDGAVISRSSRKILTAMFPLEADYLLQKETEHLNTLKLSGANVESDIKAGLEIGEAIAVKALTRASTDGMKKAQVTKAVGDSIAKAAFDRFGWQWVNQEIPQRPVGLVPFYGKVKLWNVPIVTATRPGPPPAINSPEYVKSVAVLKDYQKNVTPETRRIANLWQDGLSTYTPPGHWNSIAKKYIIKYKLNPIRTARTFAYLNMAMMDGGISCWDTKYYYYYPRPIQMISGFKTILGTPNFPAYTSGHSVFSAAGAEILSYVFPNEATTFKNWAKEAAISRVYGGIHWTYDAEIGTQQGINVANYTLLKAKIDGAD